MNGRQFTILGGGIGGMAAACALAQRGAQVRVLEQAAALSEVGAGLQISPNGVAVLDALGVGRDVGLTSTAVVLRDGPSGRQVARMPVDGGPRPYLLCHRATLLDALAARAAALGVTVVLGRRVTAVADGAGGALLTFADGATEEVPFVIGADGLHSVLRATLNGADRPFFTGQVAWRALVEGQAAPEATVFMGPGRHLVRYPLAGGRINLVAVEERDAWADEGWHHPGDPADLRSAFAGFAPDVRALLERVETVHLWGLFRHPVAEHWHGPHGALLGDAAHPTLPFLAQGANMALEDAWVLADCLATQPGDQAMGVYQARRLPRVSRAIAAANANARNYHHRNALKRRIGHGALSVVSTLAPGLLLRPFDWLYGHDVTA